MIPVEEYSAKMVIDKPILCHKHKTEALKYNCKDCRTLICITCALLDHEGHKYETIDDALMTYSKTTEELTQQVRTNAKIRADRVMILQGCKARINSIFESADAKANEHKNLVLAKIEADYQDIKDKLTQIKEQEIHKVEKSIQDETSKSTELRAVAGCVRSVLLTTEGASLLKEIQQHLLPTLNEITESEKDIPVLPFVEYPFFKQRDIECDRNVLGEVSTLLPHSRFQKTDFHKVFSIDVEPTQKIDITLTKMAQSHRIAFGHNTILVLLRNLSGGTIMLYSTDGSHKNEIKLDKSIKEPKSAAFVDEETICIAAPNGLFTITIEERDINLISGGKYSDVHFSYDTLYALRYDNGKLWIATRAHDGILAETRNVDTGLSDLSASSTFVVLFSSIFICDHHNKVYEFSLTDKKLKVITIDCVSPTICAVNDAGDVLVTGPTAKIVAAGKTQVNCKFTGVHDIRDVVYEDSKTFWLFDRVSGLKYRLLTFSEDK